MGNAQVLLIENVGVESRIHAFSGTSSREGSATTEKRVEEAGGDELRIFGTTTFQTNDTVSKLGHWCVVLREVPINLEEGRGIEPVSE